MSWNLFIIPLAYITVELLKNIEKLKKAYLPWIAVAAGGVLGVVFALYYRVDYLEHIVSGIIYGAAAAGIYDAGQAPKYL